MLFMTFSCPRRSILSAIGGDAVRSARGWRGSNFSAHSLRATQEIPYRFTPSSALLTGCERHHCEQNALGAPSLIATL